MRSESVTIRIAIALTVAMTINLAFVQESPAPPILPNVCTVSTAGLTFGTYTPNQSSPVDATDYITVICTPGTPFLLGIDNGLNYQAPWRRGRYSSNYIQYQLFQDSGHSLLWGMTPGSTMLSAVGTGSQQNIPVYGRIAALQSPVDGSYSDTVTITVEYSP